MLRKLIFLFLLGFSFHANAQSNTSTPHLPGMATLRAAYTATELEEMAYLAPGKFEAIRYYYTGSYILTPVKCDDCAPLDLAHFDIRKYERLRQKDSRYVAQDPKHGMTITLLSVQELAYQLPIHAPQIPAENESE